MVVESHMSCKEQSGFPKVTTVQVMDGLGELFPPYPRKLIHKIMNQTISYDVTIEYLSLQILKSKYIYVLSFRNQESPTWCE